MPSAYGLDQASPSGRARISVLSSSSSHLPDMSITGWLDSLRHKRYSLLPTSGADLLQRATGQRRRLFQLSAGAILAFVVLGGVIRQGGLGSSLSEVHEVPIDSQNESWESLSSEDGREKDMWGWSESMGWEAASEKGLADLGDAAERVFRLNVEPSEDGMIEYFRRLYDFAVSLPTRLHSPLIASIHNHLPPSHSDLIPDYPNAKDTLPAMVSYKTIHMTDKTFNPDNDLIRAWQNINKNDGWTLNFMDDAQAQAWVEDTFQRSDVEWAWNFMNRGVLKADFLRYLLPLVQGGVYSDVDTRPIRPIEQWGHTNVEYLDISDTDGESWQSTLSTLPSVIVAIDVNVHAHPGWEGGWPRPLGICQWTLSSAPNHPIFLDAVRRVVNSSMVVHDWKEWRDSEVQRLTEEQPEGWSDEVNELNGQDVHHVMNVMEWTGPGLFTDSVLAFLLARYNMTWHRLRGLDHPLRIGDVLVLPITAFSPGGEQDFHAEGPDSPQANVLHNFRGSWKGDGA